MFSVGRSNLEALDKNIQQTQKNAEKSVKAYGRKFDRLPSDAQNTVILKTAAAALAAGLVGVAVAPALGLGVGSSLALGVAATVVGAMAGFKMSMNSYGLDDQAKGIGQKFLGYLFG